MQHSLATNDVDAPVVKLPPSAVVEATSSLNWQAWPRGRHLSRSELGSKPTERVDQVVRLETRGEGVLEEGQKEGADRAAGSMVNGGMVRDRACLLLC